MPQFSGKDYGSIYFSILGLIEKTAKDLYHGPRLQLQLAEWAQNGWYVFDPAAELINLTSCIHTGGRRKLWIPMSRGTTI